MNEIIVSKIFEFITDHALEDWKKRRKQEIQEILLKEIENTGTTINVEHNDDIITIIEMFFHAQRIGAAKENLRLMAKVLFNFSSIQKSIYPDDFRKYSRILAELRHEEIITLVSFYNKNRELEKEMENTPNNEVSGHLLWERVKNDLVPHKMNEDEMFSSAFSCQRYGLLVPCQTMDGLGYLKTTGLLNDLVALSEMPSIYS